MTTQSVAPSSLPASAVSVSEAIREARVGALIVRARPMFFGQRGRLAELALMNRIPTLFERLEYAEAGGLAKLYRRTGKDGRRRSTSRPRRRCTARWT